MYRVDIASKKLIELKPTGFSELGLKERFDIQEWIEKTPEILGEELLVISKELILPSGKRLDLLAIDKYASLVVIELKRDDSGSSVEWQSIKYASYCSNFSPNEIFRIFSEYKNTSADEASKNIEEFINNDIESLNNSQRIILASKEFNSEVVSAVLWLRDFNLNIQCTRLAPYLDDDNQLFIKPEIIIPLPEAKDYIERKELKQKQVAAVQSEWTGYWFVNVGDGPHRTWEDNIKYCYIGAGQGRSYSTALKRLSIGDKFYAYLKGSGYVGFGEVTSEPTMIDKFVTQDNKKLRDVEMKASHPFENSEDEELSEWVVSVKWYKVFKRNEAKSFSGIFANQNVVCKLRNEKTLLFIQEQFNK